MDPVYGQVWFELSNAEIVTIPHLPDADECGDLEGWYFDSLTSPELITLCPATCEAQPSTIVGTRIYCRQRIDG
jgi:hypothetical protein